MEAAAVGKLHILIAEVKLQFKECGEVYELLPQCFQLFGVASPQLADGKAVGCGIGGVDKVCHRLGLREVEFAVEKRTAGEFAGLCQPCAAVEEGLQERLLYVEGTVAGYLHGVVACVGMRCVVRGGDDLVQHFLADAEELGMGCAGAFQVP